VHLSSTTAVITLEHKGKTFAALIDRSDYDKVKDYRWHASKHRRTFYARTRKDGKNIYMHQLLTGVNNVDHRNRCGLDNRRANLRIGASPSQQAANQSKASNARYRGVTFDNKLGQFHMALWVNRKCVYSEYFRNEEDAARAYDAAARKHFGQYASLNFPTPEELGPTAIRNLEDIPVEPGTWVGNVDDED
jgi:hypothetical protein